jgi:Ni,Fe-hydrogenase I cytochrome b subunit
MSSATLTRPRRVAAPPPAAPERRGSGPWTWIAFAVLAAAATVGFLVYPTYPNYDSYYSLLWGRELLDAELPTFETYRAPTPHPLATAVGALLSLLGHAGERVWIALCVVSFVALVVAVYRLAREAFTPLVGFAAAALVLSRFDFAFYAARGYIDIAYMAFVVWAAVLEARSPRRGTPVLVLLGIAGLLRPEAWLMAGLYWLWVAWPARRDPRRVAWYAALAAIGPVLWALTDFIVTGDPLYSLTYTSAFAEELGRAKGAEGIPAAIWAFLVKLDKTPVVLGGIAGMVAAAVLVPRRTIVPSVLLAVGIGTFALVALAGFSVIDRYLLVTSMIVIVFCALALAGWTMLAEETRARRAWAGAAAVLVLAGMVWTAVHVNLGRLDNELQFRGAAHAALHDVLQDPAVRAGLRCGPVNVPNHKLIPDVRWIAGLPDRAVLARSEARYEGPDAARRARAARVERRIAAGGVSIIPHQRAALFRQALVDETDDPATVLPLPGYERRAVSSYYAAYVRCP